MSEAQIQTADYFIIHRDGPGEVVGGIELIESSDDGGWYAHEFDFERKDNATRTSSGIYRTRAELVRALRSGKHRWEKWS